MEAVEKQIAELNKTLVELKSELLRVTNEVKTIQVTNNDQILAKLDEVFSKMNKAKKPTTSTTVSAAPELIQTKTNTNYGSGIIYIKAEYNKESNSPIGSAKPLTDTLRSFKLADGRNVLDAVLADPDVIAEADTKKRNDMIGHKCWQMYIRDVPDRSSKIKEMRDAHNKAAENQLTTQELAPEKPSTDQATNGVPPKPKRGNK